MKKHTKKIILIGITLLLLIGIIVYFSVQQSIMGPIGNLNSPVTKNVMWGYIPVTINSLYLGRANAGGDGIYLKSIGRPGHIYFCGVSGRGGSAGAFIQNSYNIGSRLSLYSAIGGGTSWGCGQSNYIKTKINFPKGILDVRYNLISSGDRSSSAVSTMIIQKHKIQLSSRTNNNIKGEYNVSVDGETNIELYSQKSYHGGVTSANAVLTFLPQLEITSPPIESSPPTFSSILSNLFGWLKNIWSSIF